MSTKRLSRIWVTAGVSSALAIGTSAMIYTFASNKLHTAIVQHAQAYLGIRETGTDDSGFTDKMFEYRLRKVGWYPGADWCGYFVKLVLLEAFSALQLPEHFYYVKKYFTGSTQVTWQNLRQNPKPIFTLSAKPRRGSVAMWRNTANRYRGHTGVVTEARGESFRTIEGNRLNDVGYMTRSLDAFTIPEGKLQLLGFIHFKI